MKRLFAYFSSLLFLFMFFAATVGAQYEPTHLKHPYCMER